MLAIPLWNTTSSRRIPDILDNVNEQFILDGSTDAELLNSYDLCAYY
jgi:hypothetical protein